MVCTLSGEDIFLEKLAEPFYSAARGLLRQRAAELPAFVAMNRYYADFMAEYLAVPRERIEVIPPGLNLEGHGISKAGCRIAETVDHHRVSGPDLPGERPAPTCRGLKTACR